MHKLEDLKKMLCKELETYADKSDLTVGSLDVIDKLAHAIKNLCKVIESYDEEEYSNRGGSYNSGGSYGYSRTTGDRMGGNMASRGYSREEGYSNRRDSMGRYSRDGHSNYVNPIIPGLNDMLQMAPDDQTRQELTEFIRKIENM